MNKILFSKTRGILLLNDLKVAQSFSERGIGLLNTKSLTNQQGLLIPHNNWIHTFFMKMDIDCVFLDKGLRIKKIVSRVKPWRMAGPVLSARSVLEIKSGLADDLKLQLGEELYVGT